ncbi:LytTR family DNA-binding domain-containing protein [Roseovarius pacificus]|uniref:LytTR family DNA-binding domain-containing protein n=1 Tax=Roseovarius pacificus TaxID=337701 RepID=UPI00296A84A8|nr:LytTR family DNA-binding domain-containing protein [Roseovarius pacificus]
MLPLGEIRDVFARTYSSLFSPLTIFIWVACIVLATLAGPFGTYETMDWSTRLFYWSLVVSIGMLFGYGARGLAVLAIGFERPLIFDAFASLSVCVTFGPIVWMLRSHLEPANSTFAVHLFDVMLNTFVVSAGIFVLRRQICRSEPVAYLVSHAEDETPQPDQPRLLRRLPKEKRGRVLRISANDHYVEVVTTAGSEVLRMRLADAIDEMEPVEGYCVHRSHWVTRSAIVGTERESAHKLFVLLCNGDRVPVSRKYRPNLEEAGLVSKQQGGLAIAVKG